MTARRKATLREIGLAPLWQLRSAAASEVPARSGQMPSASATLDAQVDDGSAQEAPSAGQAADRVGLLDWPQLEQAVTDCRICRLCEQRKQAVFGVGDRNPDWLFVGEGPGAEEDERGEPFVGQAGKLLDAMLAAIGLQRGRKVYIANAVKCRPPGNRTPDADEMAACRPYLARQIRLLRPRLIVAMGRPAAQTLLQSEIKIAAMRGRVQHYVDGDLRIPVLVTYHPAYLLRNLNDKAKAWEDLCLARATMTAQPPRPPIVD